MKHSATMQGNAGTIRALAPHEVLSALDTYAFGRPPLYGEKMKQTAVRLPEYMVDWLKAQPGGMSETVRKLVQAAMNKDREQAGMMIEKPRAQYSTPS